MDSDTISTLRPGTMLRAGAYRIVRYLSKGGFGITYLAEHTLLEKRVAIKELYISEWCNRDARGAISVGVTANKVKYDKLHRKFISEAKAQCHLDHPGVVRVSDVFEENGTAYYVMDYIDGQSLAKLLEQRRGGMSESEALGYIRQVADALAYVHSTGRLHLDIKPANIKIDRTGRAILIDFGVSKQYDPDGLNDSTLIGHTPGFSSPEQSAGDMRYFSPASDIYSLGATLYNLLTSRRIPDTALRFSGEPIPALPAGISSSTAAAIEASLRLRKDRRPQSIQAFLALLNASDETRRDSEPKQTSSAFPPTTRLTQAPRSRKPLWITLAILAIAATAALTFFLTNKHTPTETLKNIDHQTSDTIAHPDSIIASSSNSSDSTMSLEGTTSTLPSPAKTQPRQQKSPGQLAEEKAKKDVEAHKKRTEDSLYAAINSRNKADKWDSDKNTSRTAADNSHGAAHNAQGEATGRNGVHPGKSGSGAGRIGTVKAPTGLSNLPNGSYVVYVITLPENQSGKITSDMIRELSSRGLSSAAGQTAKNACLRQIIGMPFKAAEGCEVTLKFTFTH